MVPLELNSRLGFVKIESQWREDRREAVERHGADLRNPSDRPWGVPDSPGVAHFIPFLRDFPVHQFLQSSGMSGMILSDTKNAEVTLLNDWLLWYNHE